MIRTVGIVAALFTVSSLARAESRVPVRLAMSSVGDSQPLYAASLAPVRHATVSTRLGATVQRVLVAEGTHVKRGQLLLTLSDEDVRAQLTSANTALANASAYERRIGELVGKRAATPVELEAAQAQRAQANAAVTATRASLAYTQLRAPFDGVVQARRVNAGDFVGPGQPLVEIEGAELEVQATLSEDEAASLHIGQRIPFESENHRGEAEITALTPGGDALSHRRALRATVIGSKGLRSGAFARIQVPGGPARTQTRVPRSALVQRGDLTGVFVAENGRARLRWLAVGDAAGPDVSVRAGLAANDAVSDNPGSLRDEQAVEVINGR
jgi:membrane fusion protein (multidrug efflux system)